VSGRSSGVDKNVQVDWWYICYAMRACLHRTLTTGSKVAVLSSSFGCSFGASSSSTFSSVSTVAGGVSVFASSSLMVVVC
jgi:hypothetical protein